MKVVLLHSKITKLKLQSENRRYKLGMQEERENLDSCIFICTKPGVECKNIEIHIE